MDVEIAGQSFRALVDTGSDVSIVTLDVLSQIGRRYDYYSGPRTDTANNVPIKPMGQSDLRMTLKENSKKLTIETTVMVVDQLPSGIAVLLGQDVAIVVDLQISCKNKTETI